MTDHKQGEQKPLWREALVFAIAMWAGSRLVILIAMLLLAPALPAPEATVTPGWQLFAHWDGEHYQSIATKGYRFRDDGKGYNVAFFPLFPLLMRGAMTLGLPAAAAGTVINNLAFLGAMVVLYLWVAERHDRRAARWATAALAWCPFSLFGTVVYTEGLFLLGSTAALRAFDQRQYRWAAVWGALTTAMRPPGIALIPTFLVIAWREKREPAAYLAALLSSAGLLLYVLYCGLQFNQPLAFVLAQRGWRSPQDFVGEAWVDLWTTVLIGPVNEDKGWLTDPWYPLAMLLIGLMAGLLWRYRRRFAKTGYAACGLVVLLWLVGGAPLINVVVVFGGAYLIWRLRRSLSPVALVYAGFSWAIIFSSGRTTSAERYAYGAVTLAIAFGLLLSRYPRWGRATLLFFAILLASYSVRFAQGLWAG